MGRNSSSFKSTWALEIIIDQEVRHGLTLLWKSSARQCKWSTTHDYGETAFRFITAFTLQPWILFGSNGVRLSVLYKFARTYNISHIRSHILHMCWTGKRKVQMYLDTKKEIYLLWAACNSNYSIRCSSDCRSKTHLIWPVSRTWELCTSHINCSSWCLQRPDMDYCRAGVYKNKFNKIGPTTT